MYVVGVIPEISGRIDVLSAGSQAVVQVVQAATGLDFSAGDAENVANQSEVERRGVGKRGDESSRAMIRAVIVSLQIPGASLPESFIQGCIEPGARIDLGRFNIQTGIRGIPDLGDFFN
ncbi:hypothetical protein [Burkholderia sp. F1]|uniref:hypothetical protein n=1 Tax=Burkholderia sp. F1 TaxID=3366817 RepID=UPI003D713890